MNFTLTAQMIDKIAFAMEDQKERFAVDVDSGELVPFPPCRAACPRRSTSALPRWGSAEGFHLMESFVTSLDNPAYREQLSRALTMGKGVFRAFKDALKQNKEIEKLWFAYKERRLRGVIVSWYNANREARGLAKLPVEPEETEELVMSDFSFTWGVGEQAAGGAAARPGRLFRAVSRRHPGRPGGALRREKRRVFPRRGAASLAAPHRGNPVRGAGRLRLGRDRRQARCTSCSLPSPPPSAAWGSGRSS